MSRWTCLGWMSCLILRTIKRRSGGISRLSHESILGGLYRMGISELRVGRDSMITRNRDGGLLVKNNRTQ